MMEYCLCIMQCVQCCSIYRENHKVAIEDEKPLASNSGLDCRTFGPLFGRQHAVVIQDVIQVLLLVFVHKVVDRLIGEVSLLIKTQENYCQLL